MSNEKGHRESCENESLAYKNCELAKQNAHYQCQLKRYLEINNVLMSQSFDLHSKIVRLTKQKDYLQKSNTKMKQILEKINEETFQLFKQIYVDSSLNCPEEEADFDSENICKPYVALKKELETISTLGPKNHA